MLSTVNYSNDPVWFWPRLTTSLPTIPRNSCKTIMDIPHRQLVYGPPTAGRFKNVMDAGVLFLSSWSLCQSTVQGKHNLLEGMEPKRQTWLRAGERGGKESADENEK